MIEMLKKSFYAGIGATMVTAEKVDEALQDLVKRGKISSEDARQTAKKVADESKREFDEARRSFDEVLDDWLDRAPVVRKRDFAALEERVTFLEAKLKEVEWKHAPEQPGEPNPPTGA